MVMDLVMKREKSVRMKKSILGGGKETRFHDSRFQTMLYSTCSLCGLIAYTYERLGVPSNRGGVGDAELH